MIITKDGKEYFVPDTALTETGGDLTFVDMGIDPTTVKLKPLKVHMLEQAGKTVASIQAEIDTIKIMSIPEGADDIYKAAINNHNNDLVADIIYLEEEKEILVEYNGNNV